jgi:hypothetical protein
MWLWTIDIYLTHRPGKATIFSQPWLSPSELYVRRKPYRWAVALADCTTKRVFAPSVLRKSVERAAMVLKPNGGGAEAMSSSQRLFIMSTSFDPSLPSDITLLLRADAEHCWLHREVIPVLRQVESRERLPDEQVGAALAYLEAMWSEATIRARETDAAGAHVSSHDGGHNSLSSPAERYHTVVRALRGVLAERVTPFMEPAPAGAGGPLSEALRVEDTRTETRRASAGGCAPRAA